MLVFVIPMLASNVLQSLTLTINSIYLGRLIGVSALAAVSGYFPFGFFLISFFMGIATASSVLIGQAFGARETDKMLAVAGTTITTCLAMGAVIALFGGGYAETILRAVGTPPDILPLTLIYARIMLLAQPIIAIYLVYTIFLRGTGDSRTPFYALILTTIINMALTPALILGWAGLPRLGVASGAYANIVAYIATLICLALYLNWLKHPLAPNRKLMAHLGINWPIFKTLIRIGIPTALQMVLISLAGIAVIAFVNRFGSIATAAYGAVNQITSYAQAPAFSMGMAGTIFGAQAIGRGNSDHLGAITRTALLLNLMIGGTIIALGYVFAYSILGLFLADPKTLALAYG